MITLESKRKEKKRNVGCYSHALAAMGVSTFKHGVLHVNDLSLDFSSSDAFLRSVCTE